MIATMIAALIVIASILFVIVVWAGVACMWRDEVLGYDTMLITDDTIPFELDE